MRYILMILLLLACSCRTPKDVHKTENHSRIDSLEYVSQGAATIQTHIDTTYMDNVSIEITELKFARDSVGTYIEKLTHKKIQRDVESKGIDSTFVTIRDSTKFHNISNYSKISLKDEKAKTPRWWVVFSLIAVILLLGFYNKHNR